MRKLIGYATVGLGALSIASAAFACNHILDENEGFSSRAYNAAVEGDSDPFRVELFRSWSRNQESLDADTRSFFTDPVDEDRRKLDSLEQTLSGYFSCERASRMYAINPQYRALIERWAQEYPANVANARRLVRQAEAAFGMGEGNGAPSSGSVSSGITGSCKADQDALIARLSRLQSSPPAGICANARAAHPIHVDMANFYARCPSADPSGQMRQMALENVRITKQQMGASCAN